MNLYQKPRGANFFVLDLTPFQKGGKGTNTFHLDQTFSEGRPLQSEANSFLLLKIPFQKGGKSNLDRVASHESVSISLNT